MKYNNNKENNRKIDFFYFIKLNHNLMGFYKNCGILLQRCNMKKHMIAIQFST